MKQVNSKQFGIVFFILLGLILAFSPIERSKVSSFDAVQIATAIEDRSDHISADQLGQLIIDKDPDYILIDVRGPQEFDLFHIPSAVNLPLEILFQDSVLSILDPEKLIILYSNGGTHAAQAWVLLRQLGFERSTVLLGGLNYWVEVYSNPQPPQDIEADSEVFLYQFRVAAGKTLMGDISATEQKSTQAKPLPAIPIKRKVKKSGDEGC